MKPLSSASYSDCVYVSSKKDLKNATRAIFEGAAPKLRFIMQHGVQPTMGKWGQCLVAALYAGSYPRELKIVLSESWRGLCLSVLRAWCCEGGRLDIHQPFASWDLVSVLQQVVGKVGSFTLHTNKVDGLVERIGDAIESNDELTELQLLESYVTLNGLARVFSEKSLRHLRKMTLSGLRMCEFGRSPEEFDRDSMRKASSKISQLLCYEDAALQEFEMTGMGHVWVNLDRLAGHLASGRSQLRKLTLAYWPMAPKYSKRLSDEVIYNLCRSALVELSLDGVVLDEQGAAAFSRELEHNFVLRKLKIRCCSDIPEHCAIAMVAGNRSIAEFEVNCYMPYGDDKVGSAVASLRHNDVLRKFIGTESEEVLEICRRNHKNWKKKNKTLATILLWHLVSLKGLEISSGLGNKRLLN